MLLLQYWEDAAFAKENRDYGGPLRQDSLLALFVKHHAQFLFSGLSEITHSEIDRCTVWVSFGNLRHSPEEWDRMHEETKEVRKRGKVLQDNTHEAYCLEARSEWDIVNLHMGAYPGFPCPRYDPKAHPGDLKGKERFPTPNKLPQITPREYECNVARWNKRKEAIETEKLLPPGAGGNPTTKILDENDKKIRMIAFRKCRKSCERRKTEAKVRFEEPGTSARPALRVTPPTKAAPGMDRDAHGELLDYEDDIGEPPFDLMNDELPSTCASWDSELDGPSMDVTPSQESVLLANDPPRGPGMADADHVTRMLSGLSPDAFDVIAIELAKLHAQSTPTPPHPARRTIFEKVLGDLGPTVTKKKGN